MATSDIIMQAVEEVKKKVDIASGKAAKVLGKEVHETFMSAIRYFYSSYNSVQRGYNMFDFDSGVSAKKTYSKKLGECTYICGIHVDPSFMKGNPYAKKHGWDFLDPGIVFNLSYLGGVHGFDESMVDMHNAFVEHRTKYNKAGTSTWSPKKVPGKTQPPDEKLDSDFENKYTQSYVESVIARFKTW